MRKLLIASAALLGLTGPAFAAGIIEFNPTTSPPTVGDATGTPITPPRSGFPSPSLNPDPGKIIIRLDGFLAFDTGFIGGMNHGDVWTAGVKTGTGKLDSFTNNGLFRLYFGADGQLLNGLRYGVNAEMRTNFAGPNTSASTYTVSGGIGNASGNSTASLWYTRRAFGYVGTPAMGYIRFGQGDGPLSVFTGSGITTGEAFSTGAWDGDVPDLMPGNLTPTWMFYDVGNEYTSNKIAYLSPTFFGLQGMVSYAPNSSVLSPESCGSAAAGACLQQSSSTLGSDFTRPRNILEAAVRWQGNLGPAAIDAMVGYAHSGVVNNGNFGAAGGTKAKGVDVIDGGASVTFLGASIFGHANTGTQNGTMTPVAVVPGRGAPKGTAWVAGAQYATGPWTVGASYYYMNREGSGGGLGNETFRGEAVGGDYNWAPGFDTFLEYLHGERRQAGVNYLDSGTGVPAGLHNHISLNGIALTMLLRW
jgi:outer membrane protein OmpU